MEAVLIVHLIVLLLHEKCWALCLSTARIHQFVLETTAWTDHRMDHAAIEDTTIGVLFTRLSRLATVLPILSVGQSALYGNLSIIEFDRDRARTCGLSPHNSTSEVVVRYIPYQKQSPSVNFPWSIHSYFLHNPCIHKTYYMYAYIHISR